MRRERSADLQTRMRPTAPPSPRPEPLTSALRNYFLTGIVVAAPLAITIYSPGRSSAWIDCLGEAAHPGRAIMPETYLPFTIPGFGLLVAFSCITLLGFLTANLVGRSLSLRRDRSWAGCRWCAGSTRA